jgi:S1-C subfamily serine protease
LSDALTQPIGGSLAGTEAFVGALFRQASRRVCIRRGERGAAPPVPDRLAGRAGSGPASFADVVDEVKPAVIGVQARLAGNTDDRNVPGSPTDRSSPRSGAPQAAPPQPRRPGRIVTAQGSGFFISADGYAGRTERATADDADSSRSKM